jgi:phage-related protein
MVWTVSFVNALAEAELTALPLDMRAHFARLTDLFRDHGVAAMREPYAKHLSGKLWELRLKGRDGIARSIYVTASGQRIVVLRTFVKKTEKTPPRELDLALARMKEIKT